MSLVERDVLQTFGPRARAYGARLPRSLAAIVCDGTDSAQALSAAMRLRREGETFYAFPMLDDNRSLVAMEWAKILLQQLSGDALRQHFDALAAEAMIVGQVEQKNARAIDPLAVATLNDLVLAADALLVRSQVELQRLRGLLRGVREWVAIAPGIDATVPRVRSRGKGGPIVVWAPDYDAWQLGVFAYAMESFLDDCVIACSGGEFPNVRARFVRAEPSVLEGASTIVDASVSDPATAIALAGCGVPLVCAITSGAEEFVRGLRVYAPWSWRSIVSAVSAARSGTVPVVFADPLPIADLSRTLELAGPPKLEAEPLVSIVVPTYNRLAQLEEFLQSFERQRYGNFEIVVVNDAGEAVESVTSKFPRARVVNHEVNGGPHVGCNTGIAHARGEYIAFSGDDDLLFPDFIARSVAAMMHSGAPVANSDGMIQFWKTGEDGERRVAGYRWLSYLHLDRFEQLWAMQVSVSGMMFHRSVFEKHGPLDGTLTVADYEITARLSRLYDFVHVDHLTNEFNYLMDGSSYSHAAGFDRSIQDYRTVFARYPSAGSVFVDQGRANTFAWFEQKHGGNFWEPAIYLTPPAQIPAVSDR